MSDNEYKQKRPLYELGDFEAKCKENPDWEIITEKEWCESIVREGDAKVGTIHELVDPLPTGPTYDDLKGSHWVLTPFVKEMGEGSFTRIFLSCNENTLWSWVPESEIGTMEPITRIFSCRAELPRTDYDTFMDLWESARDVYENIKNSPWTTEEIVGDGHSPDALFVVNPRIDFDEDTDYEKYPMGRLVFESELELDDYEMLIIDEDGYETTKIVRGLRWFFDRHFGLRHDLHRMGDTLALGEDPNERWYEQGTPTAKRGIQYRTRHKR